MKNFEFMELNAQELEEVNGGGIGGPPIGNYVSSESIGKAGRAVSRAISDTWDYIKGFGEGFFN